MSEIGADVAFRRTLLFSVSNEAYRDAFRKSPGSPNAISDINYVRNGLLLNLVAFDEFKRWVAFLPIPNIYMDLTDINPPPTAKSYIVHDFQHSSSAFRNFCIRPFQPPHIASHGWPPDVPFDAIYASTLCKSWGFECFRDYMTPAWNDDFYGRLSEVQGEETKHYPPQDLFAFLVRRAARAERRKSREMMARFWINRPDMESIRDRAVRLKVQEWFGVMRWRYWMEAGLQAVVSLDSCTL